MANNQNLKPFKKGQSGNPKGRPKGSVNVTTKLRTIIEEDCPLSESEMSNRYLVPSLAQALLVKYGDIPLSYMLINQMIYNALLAKNTERGIEAIFDRLYGKPQPAGCSQYTTPDLVIAARDFEVISEEKAAEIYSQIVKDCNALVKHEAQITSS